MQQFLEKPPDGKVRIAVDHREDAHFDELFKSLGADVERRALSVGDFLCSARLAIERKTRSDFEQSVVDGRLFSQLPNLISNYERVVIIVEGTSGEGRLARASLLGAYAAIAADYGASLVFTDGMEGTAELVFAFAKHEQLGKRVPLRIYAKKKTFTPSQTARSIVESLPMVGPKGAKALLAHFGSVDALARASERELSEVPGVGKKRAKMIRAILAYEYREDEDQPH
ncbi:MAG: ERCC4 domain-containing protein [Candidatus ainarchaeum sp.]|nr:ERCC4 domain-containing protein [Candidatus ainarchaeum sp.]